MFLFFFFLSLSLSRLFRRRVSKLHSLQKNNKKWFRSSLVLRFLRAHLSSLDLLRTEVRQGEGRGGGGGAKSETRRWMHKVSSWSTCYNMHLTRTHLSIRSQAGETEHRAAAPDKVMAVAQIATKVWIPAPAAAACSSVPRLSTRSSAAARADARTDGRTRRRTNQRTSRRTNRRTNRGPNERTSAPYLYVYVYVYIHMHTSNLNTCLWPPKKFNFEKIYSYFSFLIAKLYPNF
jgi:hypothetical protein